MENLGINWGELGGVIGVKSARKFVTKYNENIK